MGGRYLDELEKYSTGLERDNADLVRDLAELRNELRKVEHRNFIMADGICVMAGQVQKMAVCLKHVESHLEKHDCFELDCPECALLHEIRPALTKPKEKTYGREELTAKEPADT